MGVSTVTQAVEFCWSFLFPRNRGLVISHEIPSSEHLLSMQTLYWDTCPWNPLYSTKWLSKNNIYWRESHSSVSVVTAKNLSAGRSRTIHFLHGSEVAFWPDAGTLMTGLRQTIPEQKGTVIVLESTANGVGNWWYDTWEDAVAGNNDYDPLFFPWWVHHEYRASFIGHTIPLTDLDEEERLLKVLMRSGLHVGRLRYSGLTSEDIDDALRWRRYAIRALAQNDINQFHQEYPSTPDEAFISTGNNVFPASDLKAVYQPTECERGFLIPSDGTVKFLKSDDGPLHVWRHPSADHDWGRYFVGGDPTRTMRGDPACAQVINRRTGEQVAVLHKRVDPTFFASDLHLMARYYNNATISTESRGPGYATIGALVHMGYPYLWRSQWANRTPGSIAQTYGFESDLQRKHGAVGHLLARIVEGAQKQRAHQQNHTLMIHDPTTYKQLRDYTRLDNGEYGPPTKSGHDDAVMALAIAYYCDFLDPPLPPYGQQSARDPEVPWEAWAAGADAYLADAN